MIAEKASDMILGRPAPAPENAPFYRQPDWQSKQRPEAPVRPPPASY